VPGAETANNAAYVASKHGLAGAVFLDVRDRHVKVSLVSPGSSPPARCAGPAAGAHPERLLQPAEVAAAVRFVVTFPSAAAGGDRPPASARTP
jgi:NADP-dependent 3-hydroxy acid dehydrogenase YdfG